MVADSARHAIEQLEAQSLQVIRISQLEENEGSVSATDAPSSAAPLDPAEVTRILRQRLAGHADLATALDAYANEWPPGVNRRYFKALAATIKEIVDGRSSGPTLAQSQPAISVMAALANHASSAAVLKTVIVQAHDDLDQRLAVWRGLRYPLFLAVLTIFVLVTFQVVMMPSLRAIFGDFGVHLPVVTRLLFAVSQNWPAVILGIIVIGLAFRLVIARHVPQWIVDRIPVVGKLLRATARTTFLQTLAGLLAAGLGRADAVRIAGESNPRRAIRRAAREWQKTMSVPSANMTVLAGTSEIPHAAVMALRSEKPAGEIARFLSVLARCQRLRSGEAWRDLATISEPFAILLVGVVIFLLLLGVFLPLVQFVKVLS
jgi:type II secretory pathway component PulF